MLQLCELFLSIDLDAYSQAVSLAADFPEIFGSTQLNGFGH